MNKIFGVFFLISLTIITCGQDSWKSSIYYDVDIVMKDIMKNDIVSQYYDKIDFESILFLDTSYYQVIFKISPEDSLWFQSAYRIVGKENYSDTIQTSILTITELFQFNNKHILQDYFKSKGTSEYELYREVYIKNSEKIIIYISGENWGAKYKLKYLNGFLFIENLGGFIADRF